MSEKIRHRQKAGQSNHKMPHSDRGEYNGNHRSNVSKDRRSKRREQRDFNREIFDQLSR